MHLIGFKASMLLYIRYSCELRWLLEHIHHKALTGFEIPWYLCFECSCKLQWRHASQVKQSIILGGLVSSSLEQAIQRCSNTSIIIIDTFSIIDSGLSRIAGAATHSYHSYRQWEEISLLTEYITTQQKTPTQVSFIQYTKNHHQRYCWFLWRRT